MSAFTTFMVQWLAQQQAATSQHPHRAPTTGLQPAYNQPTTDPQRGGVFGAPGPQYAPASHLSSYPPPPGGAHVPPPFDAARSASFSSQPAHSGVTVSNNNHTHSPVNVYIDHDRGSTPERQRTATASTARRPLAPKLGDGFHSLASNVRPVDPLLSDKTPSTPEALRTALFAWYDQCKTIVDRFELDAMELYIRTTLRFLDIVDTRHVLDYHLACAAAAYDGKYDKQRDGAVYAVAYSMHIGPFLGARGGGRNARGPRGGKRKDMESSPPGCPLPGHAGHSADRCYTTHPNLRPSSLDSKNRSAASEHKSEAAAAPEDKKKKKKAKKEGE